jgi:hypothetical protein
MVKAVTGTFQIHPLGFSGSSWFNAYSQQRHALIYSESHRRTTKVDSGGPFMAEHYIKQVWPSTNAWDYVASNIPQQKLKFVAASPMPGIPPTLPPISSFADEQTALRAAGATGWKRARPGNPAVEAGQWLAELRSLPTLPLRAFARMGFFRALGSEYLNYNFGWKPFVQDLIKMYEVYQTLDKRLKELVQNNGKGVRRRRKVSDTTETSSTTVGGANWSAFWPYPANITGMQYQSTLTTQTVTKEKIWFAGRFRYYVPDIGSDQWTSRATRALFGLNPTPSLLWEVLPWSWLIDYFANVGDVVSNMSSNAVDNLTADYAYVMRTKTVTTTYTAAGTISGSPLSGLVKASGGFFDATTQQMLQTKSRARATPYGFGVTLGSLSGYQLSILGALGASRQRFL